MGDDDNGSFESLLDDFLSDISRSKQEEARDTSDPNDFFAISGSAFPVLQVHDHTLAKIEELKSIANTIESKKLTLPDVHFKKKEGNYKIEYEKSLNREQLIAVTNIKGPLLVIAGAGSGKTRVIVYRVSYLLETGVDPESILLLTFTRKAAQEMLSRAEVLLKDQKAAKVSGGTFHSFASLILRKYANLIGIPANFTIIDTQDSEDVIDLIRSQLKYDQKSKQFPRKKRIFEIISHSRNRDLSIQQVIDQDYSGLHKYAQDIQLIGRGYAEYKRISNTFDFDDLMEVLRDKLKENLTFRERLQQRYTYIMVDEFQDTNIVQKEIIDLLAEKHRNVMVVGDDSQSIYSFRGANYENILRFPQVYSDCHIVKIEQNYRSNQRILDFTNTIIRNARIGYKKILFSEIPYHLKPTIVRLYDQQEEARFIVDRISEFIERDVPLNQIAVLNRADWHNRYIQVELNKRGIPYVVVGGFKFNERMHIKDMIAYLRIIENPTDFVAWHRILKLVPGVGKITSSNILTALRKENDKYSFNQFSNRNFYDELEKLGKMFRKASRPEVSIVEKISIVKDYYTPLLALKEADISQRLLDIEVLVDLAKKYKSMDRFLSDFALDPPARYLTGHSTPLVDESEEKGKVTVSTIHSAKGLEWYAVFVPHALDGMIPSNRATNMEELEEERRLFYVACSRTREELFITMPSYVSSFNAFFNMPSRFLVEIDKDKFEFKSNP